MRSKLLAGISVAAALGTGAVLLGAQSRSGPTITPAGVIPEYTKQDAASQLQAAADVAIANRLPLLIDKVYYTTGTLDVSAAAGSAFVMKSDGGGQILIASGQDMVRYDPTVPALGKIVISDLSVRNVGPANTGSVLTVDCTRANVFCTMGTSTIRDVYADNVGRLASFRGVGSFHVVDNWLVRPNNSAAVHEDFVDLDGGTSPADRSCNAGIYIDGNTVIGGALSRVNGCAQGIRWRDNNLGAGYKGIYQTNPYYVEQLQIIHNSMEAWGGGVLIPQSAFDQIEQNAFNEGPVGSYADWHAMVIGTAHTANADEIVDHNNVFGFNGAVTDTPIIANIGNGGTFDGNVVGGVIGSRTHICMQVGTDDSGNTKRNTLKTPPLTVIGNSAWVCGSISALGTAPFIAQGNQYNLDDGKLASFKRD
ncbi:hypothetical protein [Lichenicola sp.]|uniref:hypothetical protein n=1 Tax=Lichenicola sp. TaxID=2804529 RepID=UPI003B0023C2